MKKWLVIVCMLFAMVPANAIQELHFDGLIADEANLLSSQAVTNLNSVLLDLQKKSGASLAVVTVKTLNGEPIERAAQDIIKTYKLGSEKQNGAVFLTALYDREMRFQLDSGLEYKVYMSKLHKVRDNEVLSNYSKGDYENGIIQGTKGLATLIAEAENITLNTTTNTYKTSQHSRRNCPRWVYLFAIILRILFPRRRYGGFGGGGFSGGGGFCCSGRW